ncbi:MAG: hypothetical protein K2N03_02385 [Muribaculaceae bacterium]|nr:hypothetical protein [Muribaculaceae bacterium]
MKVVKLIIIALGILVLIGVVFMVKDMVTPKLNPEHRQHVKELQEGIEQFWSKSPGWNGNQFEDDLSGIRSALNNQFISEEEAGVCENQLGELALRATCEALDRLYANPDCRISEVKKEYDGILRIEKMEGFAGDSDIHTQQEIFKLYNDALQFKKKGLSASPGFSFPDKWNNFAELVSNYRSQASSIRNNEYWIRLSDIREINGPVEESAVEARIQKARSAFASALAEQIERSYSGRSRTVENKRLLHSAIVKYQNQFPANPGLDGFEQDFMLETDEGIFD